MRQGAALPYDEKMSYATHGVAVTIFVCVRQRVRDGQYESGGGLVGYVNTSTLNQTQQCGYFVVGLGIWPIKRCILMFSYTL